MRRDSGSRVPPKLIVGGLIAALALIFVFQNTGRGRVNYLFWNIEAPAWLWLLIIFLAGAVAGWVTGRSRLKRRHRS